MKDYNPKKPKEYHLSKSLYNRVISTVRDYPRMVEKVNNVLYGSSCGFAEYKDYKGKTQRTILPKANGTGNPTEQKAIAIEHIQDTIDCINKALTKMPIEYRQYIFDNIVYGAKYPLDYANKATWSRWRMKFLCFVAENLQLL